MQIRQGNAHDANELSRLVLASATELLPLLFPPVNGLMVEDYLTFSLAKADGQYGYQNHWVVEDKGELIACVSAWHTDLPRTFHQASLSSLVDFYGPEQVASILVRNQRLQSCILPLQPEQWCVGHLAVTPSHQCRGIATRLLEFMQQQGLQHNKTHMCLDVVASNYRAINLYARLGYTPVELSTQSNDNAGQSLPSLIKFIRFERCLLEELA